MNRVLSRCSISLHLGGTLKLYQELYTIQDVMDNDFRYVVIPISLVQDVMDNDFRYVVIPISLVQDVMDND